MMGSMKLKDEETESINAPEGQLDAQAARGRLSDEQIKSMVVEDVRTPVSDLPRPFLRFTHFPSTIVAMVQSKGYEVQVLEREGGCYNIHLPDVKAFTNVAQKMLGQFKRLPNGHYEYRHLNTVR